MSLRIAYWTSGFEPSMEAVSSEVHLLRRSFPRSVVWGLSHRRWCRLSLQERSWCLHPRLHLVFRGMTRLLESRFDLNHVFGSLGDWFYLEGRRRRPIVLTATVFSTPVHPSLLERVDRFVVESTSGRELLQEQGIDASRIRLVFPPVDLKRFTPMGKPNGPFTVLFASSPERVAWLESRGILLLLDTAALLPDVHFRLLWRPWGNGLREVREWVQRRSLRNVEISVGRFADMASQYQAAHITIAPFTRIEHCKLMPNSLIESLACGRPVLATPQVGLSQMIADERCGLVTEPCAHKCAMRSTGCASRGMTHHIGPEGPRSGGSRKSDSPLIIDIYITMWFSPFWLNDRG